MDNASSIDDAQRAVAFRSALVHRKRVTSRTTSSAIGLWNKIGSGKAFGERTVRPSWRAILGGLWSISSFLGGL